ncbi:PilW family protein [Sulfuricella sp.]|uniref:PilW family protein n=1 Tax=Sulfuricella sp. TaxID=2099377 RepID=UPI002C638FEF|nr:PilW family protein [Sulfuricella sp.]HUX64293.1 PilW family protein [Sulfuricella sp.]
MMTLKTLASGRSKTDFRITLARQAQCGFTMIELMIGIVLGLLIMVALSELFVNITRTNSEMAKTNAQIENGRFAIQLLGGDIVHGGYWGGYVPKFDDLTVPATGYDGTTMAPTDPVPDPCLAYASWDAAYKNKLLAIPVQSYESLPGCAVVANQKAGTDVLVVRHVETCLPGAVNCEADTAGKLYFQAPQCEDEISAAVQAATATTITLPSFASAVSDFYKGSTIRIISGPGSYQSRLISAYDGATRVATLSVAWTTTPDNTSKYTFGDGYVLDTGGYVFHKRNCTALADKRKFISSIYYIRDYAATVGDGIPTLVRSRFDLSGGVLAHQPAEPLIEGIEGFRVEFGIDGIGDAGTVVDYTKAVEWTDPLTRDTPKNRGDGVPEGAFVRCTTAAPCTAYQLANVVAVKLYVLARNRDITVGYTDGKTYTLGTATLGPFNDHYKRHAFPTSVRLTNIAGRRETP